VFFIDETGSHGLIVATSDQSSGIGWGCKGTLIGNTLVAYGSGLANTEVIVAGCATAGIPARLCNDLVLNGYSDWYLPSQDELLILYAQKDVIGGISGQYWTSTESPSNGVNNAQAVNFVTFGAYGTDKDYLVKVRAIRSF
jgi:hypothetical protein